MAASTDNTLDITCGKCGKNMTPSNSKLAPELFLCDECANKIPEVMATIRPHVLTDAEELARLRAVVKHVLSAWRDVDGTIYAQADISVCGRLEWAMSDLIELVGLPEERTANLRRGSPDDIRERGWAVGVHNDYKLNGVSYTFWLFTKGGFCVSGEGRTDAEALDKVRAGIA